ncbi:hypothetical protein MN0502_16100 [Arthrobacter sp. MN05-02]|nr:hypothetical protein MN0502_16100 [Arthrobacter sp. MN05-02]
MAAAVKMGAERVEGPERVVQGRGQFTLGLVAALGRHVLPEDAVVDDAADVEGEVLGELGDGAELAGRAGLGELGQGVVGALDVGGLVLGVVQLHDPARDVRLQGRVVVIEIRQYVFAHVVLHVVVPGAGAPVGSSGSPDGRRPT